MTFWPSTWKMLEWDKSVSFSRELPIYNKCQGNHLYFIINLSILIFYHLVVFCFWIFYSSFVKNCLFQNISSSLQHYSGQFVTALLQSKWRTKKRTKKRLSEWHTFCLKKISSSLRKYPKFLNREYIFLNTPNILFGK